MEPSPAAAAGEHARYDALLRQVVQLNADLHKTAALSQALQCERDDLRQSSQRLKDEVKRLHERCDKLQVALMDETEQKIESDKKHEELIAKWKRQLEAKTKAFESLQQKFAPPRDLEQLRIKIQEELEGPYLNRIDALQTELERQHQRTFEVRREFEIIKTEYEQFAIDQGNEMECLQQMYAMQIADLKKKVRAAEEIAEAARAPEALRRLELLRDAASIEIKTLKAEVQDVRDELARAHSAAESERSERELRVAEALATNTALELDIKAHMRELAKAKEERDGLRSKCDHTEASMADLRAEVETLRDQLKQKDALIVSSHNTLSSKMREERASWDREHSALKDRINELTLKLQAAEVAAHQSSVLVAKRQEQDECIAESSVLAKTREQEMEKLKATIAEQERKLRGTEDALRNTKQAAEEEKHQLQLEIEVLQQKLEAIESEKSHISTSQKSSQELVSRMKSECITLRSKLKEVESDYHALQTKHRDILHFLEGIKLDNEKLEGKVKYLEQDYSIAIEKFEKEKDSREQSAHEFQAKLASLEVEYREHHASLRQETRVALSKALHELNKTQKKRDAYKKKCIEIHEQLKRMMKEANSYDSKVLQMKQQHATELQVILAQLSDAESEKTFLMQRQVEMGFAPALSSAMKSSLRRPTEPVSSKE